MNPKLSLDERLPTVRHTMLPSKDVESIESGQISKEILFDQKYKVRSAGQITMAGTEFYLILEPSYATDAYRKQYHELYGEEYRGAMLKVDGSQSVSMHDRKTGMDYSVDLGREFSARVIGGGVIAGDSLSFKPDSYGAIEVTQARGEDSIKLMADFTRRVSEADMVLLDYKALEEEKSRALEECGQLTVIESEIEGINLKSHQWMTLNLNPGDSFTFRVIDEGEQYHGEFDVVVYTPHGVVAASSEDFDFSGAKLNPQEFVEQEFSI